MHIRAPVSKKQFGSVNQRAQQPEYLAPLFTDSRQQFNELQSMQLMMDSNLHNKKINRLQEKMNVGHLLNPQLQKKNKIETSIQKKQSAAGKNIVQCAPIGAFAGAVPTMNGMFMDTTNTVAHNSNVNGNANVAGRRIAIMRGPANGGVPSVDPHGWNWLRAKFLRLKGQWVRFHLINAKLGGSGADTFNLVPTTHALNHDATWRQVEEDAKTSANTRWTYLDVTPTYDNAYPAGVPRTIQAEWGRWDAVNSRWVMRGTMPATAQDNPVNGVQPYGDASTLNRSTIKNLIKVHMPKPKPAAKKGHKKIAKRLIVPVYYEIDAGLNLLTRRYPSYDRLNTAWDTFLKKIHNDNAYSTWYKIMNRVYLTEEGPGPWPLVYRK